MSHHIISMWCNLHHMAMKRISITVSDWQYASLVEIAALDQTSIANVARDCIRAMLPQLLEVSRFVYDPRNSPTDVLAFADQMERALGLLQGGAGVGDADEVPPASRRYPAKKPPASNTGAQS